MSAKSRQNWRTPRGLYLGLCELTGTSPGCDVAADEHNRLAPLHIEEGDHDGLGALSAAADWGPAAWCNPPYQRIMPWVIRGQGAAACGTTSLWLVPSGLDTKWGRELAASAHWWLTAGRVAFIDPDTGQPGRSPPGGHMVAWMTPRTAANRRHNDAHYGHQLALSNFRGFVSPASGRQL